MSKPSPRPDHAAQDSSNGMDLITSGCKPSGVWGGGKTVSFSGQQMKGHQLHMRSGWSDWKWDKSQASPQKSASSGISPSLTPSTHTEPWLPCPGEYPRLHPTQLTRCTKKESKHLYLVHRHREAAKIRRKRNMVQMGEQNRTPEKELSNAEIANLSDTESKH